MKMKNKCRLIFVLAVIVLMSSCTKKTNYYLTFNVENIFSTTATLIRTFDKMAIDGMNSFAIEDDYDVEKWIFQFEYAFSDCEKYIIRDRVEGKTYDTNARGFQKYLANIDFSETVKYSFLEELKRKMTQRTRQVHANRLGL